MDPDLVRRIVEAALLASPQPLSLNQLAALFPEDAPAPQDSIEQALAALAEENGRRGVSLVEVASGFRFQVDSTLQPWVARLWAERPPRYSRALLETLALIAYRQPITRGEIEQIRGVAVSTHIIKTLEEREWIRVVGHRDVPGRPALFGTTRGFLDYFGLRALDQLPPLTELQDLPDLEPELPLEGIAQDASQRGADDAEAEAAPASATDAPAAQATADGQSEEVAAAEAPRPGTPQDGQSPDTEPATSSAPADDLASASTSEVDRDAQADSDRDTIADAPAPGDQDAAPAQPASTNSDPDNPPDVAPDTPHDPTGDEAGNAHDPQDSEAGDSAGPEHKA